MIFRDQVILYAQPGAIPGHMLEDLISKVKEVDMDEVRAQMAEHEHGEHEHDEHEHGDHEDAHEHAHLMAAPPALALASDRTSRDQAR